MTTMMETSRDDEHNEDAMVHCCRKTRLACGVVIVIVVRRLARRSNRRQQPRLGQAGQIRCRRNGHRQGEDDGDNGTGGT